MNVTYKYECVKIKMSIREYNEIKDELLKLLQKGAEVKNEKQI